MERQPREIDIAAGQHNLLDRRVARGNLDERLRIGEPCKIGVVKLVLCRVERRGQTPTVASGLAMPRADTLPALATVLSEVPSPTNRLGVCSGGEGGTTPALAAVVSAIVDALAELGIRHIEMPATPERAWRAVRDANGRRKT